MSEQAWPGEVLWRHQALARARRFQTETALVIAPDGGKRVLKRALHPQGNAHLQRMAENSRHLRSDQASVFACPCYINGDWLEMSYVEGFSLKQQLIQAIRRDHRAELEILLDRYRRLITAFDPCATTLSGPGRRQEIFGDLASAAKGEVSSGNIDQGFDHFILQGEEWMLIDYEWVLGFAVPTKYVLYRAAQLFFQDVPPTVSPQFRLRDMCAFYGIDGADRMLFDQMEAAFQHFVRTETDRR